MSCVRQDQRYGAVFDVDQTTRPDNHNTSFSLLT